MEKKIWIVAEEESYNGSAWECQRWHCMSRSGAHSRIEHELAMYKREFPDGDVVDYCKGPQISYSFRWKDGSERFFTMWSEELFD